VTYQGFQSQVLKENVYAAIQTKSLIFMDYSFHSFIFSTQSFLDESIIHLHLFNQRTLQNRMII